MWKRAEAAIDYIVNKSPSKIVIAKSYSDRNCINEIDSLQVIFPLAVAVHSLGLIPEEELSQKVRDWIESAVKYIEGQGIDYSFNYWIRESQDFLNFPLPDDLDDTALCLSALAKHNVEISEKYFFKLLNLEKEEGGPYRTWYLQKNLKDSEIGRWIDIDPIVNANFYYFVNLYGISLPKTRKYLIDCLKDSKFFSQYYPYDLFFIYALSRSSSCSNDEELKSLLLNKLGAFKLSTLETMEKILHSLSLTYLGEEVGRRVLYDIFSFQQKDGSLYPLPFCYHYATKSNIRTVAANSIFSTALFLELVLLKYTKKFHQKKSLKISAIDRFNIVQKEKIKIELGELAKNKEFRKGLADKDFYTPLGTVFATASSLKSKINKEDFDLLSDLSMAIHFAWSGYNIDDEILDNQRKISDIPLANVLKRIGWKYYYKVIRKFPLFEKPILDAFNACDENYVWESCKTKFNSSNLDTVLKTKFNVDYIERRMQPYLVSMKYLPILIGLNESTAVSVYNFYRSQIIIKQLDDDAHDWEEDNEAGIMTFVLYLLYKEDANPDSHLSVFWDKVIYILSDICEEEYNKALKALAEVNLKNDFMRKLLDKTYQSILNAKEEREKAARIIAGVEKFE